MLHGWRCEINMPAALAWELFEEGLQRAERTAEALLEEAQRRARASREALEKEVTEEERREGMKGIPIRRDIHNDIYTLYNIYRLYIIG